MLRSRWTTICLLTVILTLASGCNIDFDTAFANALQGMLDSAFGTLSTNIVDNLFSAA